MSLFMKRAAYNIIRKKEGGSIGIALSKVTAVNEKLSLTDLTTSCKNPDRTFFNLRDPCVNRRRMDID